MPGLKTQQAGHPVTDLLNRIRKRRSRPGCPQFGHDVPKGKAIGDLGTDSAIAMSRRNPLTGERAVHDEFVESILSTMTTCGMYPQRTSFRRKKVTTFIATDSPRSRLSQPQGSP